MECFSIQQSVINIRVLLKNLLNRVQISCNFDPIQLPISEKWSEMETVLCISFNNPIQNWDWNEIWLIMEKSWPDLKFGSFRYR